MKNIILFFISVSLVGASSIVWKVSFARVLKASGGKNLLMNQLTDLWFIVGWILFLVATFLWVYLLSKYEYSKIYPIYVGVCILLSLIIGFVFFKENTGMLFKIIGATLIICGITFITKS